MTSKRTVIPRAWTRPRRLGDVLGPAIALESEAASFLLGLDLALAPARARDSLALALIESATRLRKWDRDSPQIRELGKGERGERV